MDVVLGKLEVPLLFFFLYGCIFFVRSTRARLMVSIKCILGKLAQELSAFSLALEPREYKLLVMGDGFQIAPQTHFVAVMDSRRATETAVSLVLAEVP